MIEAGSPPPSPALLRRRGPARAVLATDFGRWPLAVRELATQPLAEIAIQVAELQDFVATGSRPARVWKNPLPQGLAFPKIGVCSWKEWPWLLPLPAAPAINLFSHCSARMRIVLSAWIETGKTAMLRFFPFVDYSAANEYRFRVRDGKLIRNTPRDSHAGSAAAAVLFEQCRDAAGPNLIDIATRSLDDRIEAWVVEINPDVQGR